MRLPRLPHLLLMALAVCLASPAYAIDPRRDFSQYVSDQWTPENGFPGGQVNAFAQTPDGYLWIGTAKGLYRFDGLNFVAAKELDPSFPPFASVLGLTTDGDGALWVWTQGSILRYRDHTFEDLTSELAPGSFITAMTSAGDGGILLSNMVHGEILYRREQFKNLASSDIFKTAIVLSIAQTSDHRIWIGTRNDGLFYLNNGQIVAVMQGLPDRKINALLPIGNGKLWIGTDSGLVLWNGSAITASGVPPWLGHVQISALMRDRDANVWIGTPRGMLRFNAEGVQQASARRTTEVTALFEDREGNVWMGSAQGIERLRDTPFVTYSVAQGLPSDSSGPIYVDSRGRTWFAPSTGGLYWMRDRKVTAVLNSGLGRDLVYSITGGKDDLWVGRQQGGLTHLTFEGEGVTAKTYTHADGLPQDSVFVVYESHDGAIWAGTLSGGVSKLKDGVFTTYTRTSGLGSNSVTSIQEGADGTMWLGTSGGLSALTAGHLRNYTSRDGLPSEDVTSLLKDTQGALWIGTATGLAMFHANGIRGIPGLPAALQEPIFGIAEGGKGSLWLATSTHVLKVNRESLINGTLKEGDLREYGLADGLQGTAGVRRQRSVVADEQGRVWFSLDRGISVISPERAGNALPSIPHVESVSADGTLITTQGLAQIPGPFQRIAFNYTGLSLSVPERIRFRYRLDGFDHEWSDPTATRQAVYTNLGPGRYRFRVKSSSNDGLWNDSEADVSLRIQPAYWQTWWFRFSCLLMLTLITWSLHRLRVRQVSQQMQARLEERLEERERIARNLHDTLLQGFISASIQLDVANDRLPGDSPAKPLVERVLELMRQVSAEGRNAIRSLRSSRSEFQDLAQALSRIGQEFALERKVDLRVVVQGEPRPLHPVIWDEAYRIAREAMINAFRHSAAAKVEVEVEYTSRNLHVRVRDNGRGIAPETLQAGREGHWGLAGMRERAEQIGAKFGVLSRTGIGTEVDLTIPREVAYASSSAKRWPTWLSRVFSAKAEVNHPPAG